MNNKKLYIAYGSNLNVKQMKSRCPDAKMMDKGLLKNYELQFRGFIFNAHATIEPSKCSFVPFVLWNISEEDETHLDCYEGYPSYYRKEKIILQIEKEQIEAMAYVMNGKNWGLPNPDYYNTIVEGYKSGGFDLSYLQKIKNKAYSHVEKMIAEKQSIDIGNMFE